MDLKDLLERVLKEMQTMQSRVDAILDVDYIVDTLCEEDYFGESYASLLKEDSSDLGDAIGMVEHYMKETCGNGK